MCGYSQFKSTVVITASVPVYARYQNTVDIFSRGSFNSAQSRLVHLKHYIVVGPGNASLPTSATSYATQLVAMDIRKNWQEKLGDKAKLPDPYLLAPCAAI